MGDVVVLPLVVSVAFPDEVHGRRHEEAEEGHDDIDRHIHPDHQVIESRHREDGQVLVEVLDGDRVAGAHEDVAAVLEEGVHGHDEEARKPADDDEQRDGDGHVVDEVHDQNDDPHGDPQRNDLDRAAQGDEAGREDGADGDPDGDDALEHRRFRQVEAEGNLGPLDDDELEVAPAPQNNVVTARETCPSLSRQRSMRQWLNSWMRYQGFFFRVCDRRRFPGCRD